MAITTAFLGTARPPSQKACQWGTPGKFSVRVTSCSRNCSQKGPRTQRSSRRCWWGGGNVDIKFYWGTAPPTPHYPYDFIVRFYWGTCPRRRGLVAAREAVPAGDRLLFLHLGASVCPRLLIQKAVGSKHSCSREEPRTCQEISALLADESLSEAVSGYVK